ncbi:unnamed protein product [Gordionus sp. m RMFG-2023]
MQAIKINHAYNYESPLSQDRTYNKQSIDLFQRAKSRFNHDQQIISNQYSYNIHPHLSQASSQSISNNPRTDIGKLIKYDSRSTPFCLNQNKQHNSLNYSPQTQMQPNKEDNIGENGIVNSYAHMSKTFISTTAKIPFNRHIPLQKFGTFKLNRVRSIHHKNEGRRVPHSSRRNERERNRVKLINQGFSALRQHVPVCQKHKKTSKVETLRAAVDYISQLSDVLSLASSDSLYEQIQNLKNLKQCFADGTNSFDEDCESNTFTMNDNMSNASTEDKPHSGKTPQYSSFEGKKDECISLQNNAYANDADLNPLFYSFFNHDNFDSTNETIQPHINQDMQYID